jgi:hypothetical protein
MPIDIGAPVGMIPRTSGSSGTVQGSSGEGIARGGFTARGACSHVPGTSFLVVPKMPQPAGLPGGAGAAMTWPDALVRVG